MTSIASITRDLDLLHKQLNMVKQERNLARHRCTKLLRERDDMEASRDLARRLLAQTTNTFIDANKHLQHVCEEHEETIGLLEEENAALRCRLEELEATPCHPPSVDVMP